MVLERTDSQQFLCWEGVVVLTELIFNSFYIGRVWWSCRELIFLQFHTLGGCGGPDRTDFFNSFYCWEGVVDLTELIC